MRRIIAGAGNSSWRPVSLFSVVGAVPPTRKISRLFKAFPWRMSAGPQAREEQALDPHSDVIAAPRAATAATLTEHDVYLFREGSHSRLYEKLGCHFLTD